MNLLTDQLIRIETPDGEENCSLPEVYAALVADKVDCFSSLRAHQEPAWHMFLAQLGAMAMHRAALRDLPVDAETWCKIIGALTRDKFLGDEPWRLVVEDWSKPAFLQPPVPAGVELKNDAMTPDALDMLITSRNHDLKQSVAQRAEPDDWIFSLVSLQTCEGFGGLKNYGIARMNRGSSSRVMMSLSPMPVGSGERATRPGIQLRRDIRQLLAGRADLLERFPIGYPERGGIALTWVKPWLDSHQFSISDLDIWFIEVCRRVRLSRHGELLAARAGNSAAERIKAKELKGLVGDPWAPRHVTEGKTLTIGAEGEFDYNCVVELLSGEWELPLLAQLGSDENADAANWSLLLKAIARGNSKTGGFKDRTIPLTGRVARALGPKRKELHQLATNQVHEVKKVSDALVGAIGVARRGGVPWCDVPADQRKKAGEKQREVAEPLRARLDAVADRLFFPALWNRFEGAQSGNDAAIAKTSRDFIVELVAAARVLLAEGLADIPCPSIKRPRAEARARRAFEASLHSNKHGFPHIFTSSPVEEKTPDAA